MIEDLEPEIPHRCQIIREGISITDATAKGEKVTAVTDERLSPKQRLSGEQNP